MPCVALCGFDVAVIKFQLIRRAGMTKRMKHHIRELSIPLQSPESIGNDRFLAGASIWQCYNEIVVEVFIAQKLFLLVLRILPLPQNVSHCFGHPHLTNTAFRFRRFQHDHRAGIFQVHGSREFFDDFFFAQNSKRGFLHTSQLFFHAQISIVIGNIRVGNVNVVPSQANDFSDSQ